MRKEVSLALSGMSSRDYVSQDSINSTSSLFKGGGDFSLPQVSRRVVGKDSNPLSPLSSPRSPRVRRAPSPISSSSVFAFHPVAPCKQPRLPMTRSYQLEIGRFRWRRTGALNPPIFSRGNNLGRCLRASGITRRKIPLYAQRVRFFLRKRSKLARTTAIFPLVTFFDEAPVIFSNCFQLLRPITIFLKNVFCFTEV